MFMFGNKKANAIGVIIILIIILVVAWYFFGDQIRNFLGF